MKRSGGNSRLACAGDANLARVPRRSLGALLEQIYAPEIMDYFSLDVEGQEAELLRGVDLARWRWRVITMEIDKKSFIDAEKLLLAAGYVAEVDIEHRGRALDRLYVHPEII